MIIREQPPTIILKIIIWNYNHLKNDNSKTATYNYLRQEKEILLHLTHRGADKNPDRDV